MICSPTPREARRLAKVWRRSVEPQAPRDARQSLRRGVVAAQRRHRVREPLLGPEDLWARQRAPTTAFEESLPAAFRNRDLHLVPRLLHDEPDPPLLKVHVLPAEPDQVSPAKTSLQRDQEGRLRRTEASEVLPRRFAIAPPAAAQEGPIRAQLEI